MGLGFHLRSTKNAAANRPTAIQLTASRPEPLFPPDGQNEDGDTGGGNQGNHSGPQAAQYVLDDGEPLVAEIQPGQYGYDDAARQDGTQRSDQRAGESGDADADKSGGVDRDGPRGHFRNGDEIGELRQRQPVPQGDDLLLNQRHGGHAAADAEQADVEEAEEQLQNGHGRAPSFRRSLPARRLSRGCAAPSAPQTRMIQTTLTPPQ